jgi:hypothetical protein
MKQFIVTFGYSQYNGTLKNKYIIVHASNKDQARAKVYNRFGNKWAMMYPSKEAAGVNVYNLQLLEELS